MTAANAMHKTLGQRDSIRPLNIIATAVDSDVAEDPDEVASTSAQGHSLAIVCLRVPKGPNPQKR